MASVRVTTTSSDEELNVTNRIDSLAVHKARLEKEKSDRSKEQELKEANDCVDKEKPVREVHVDGRVDSITLAKQRMGLSKRSSDRRSKFAKQGTGDGSTLSGSISSLGRRIVKTLSMGSSRSRGREEGGDPSE